MSIRKRLFKVRSKYFQASLPYSVVVVMLLFAVTSQAQIAKGANKFLGNITQSSSIPSNYLTYWNQITPENESKWGYVESTKGVFSWSGVDRVKNYAETNDIPWKFHTLVWNSQKPSWISSLSNADQLTEITRWFDSAAHRYPNVDMIDVVNEGYPTHQPPSYKAALGGDGTTGYDWIVKAFQLARAAWPNAILIYNDYNNCEYSSEITWTKNMVNTIKAAGAPIDAIGCQAHDAYKFDSSVVRKNIDTLATTGLPIVISEFDIPNSDDASQLAIMQKLFTMFWNHSKVAGITYWGYITGQTWKTGTGLISSSGTERSSLTWLKSFVSSNLNPPNDFPNFLSGSSGIINKKAPVVSQRSVIRKGSGLIEIFDLRGRMVKSLNVNNRTVDISSIVPLKGSYLVRIDGRPAGVFCKVQ
jgi:endo-1,4-beta-xylanase